MSSTRVTTFGHGIVHTLSDPRPATGDDVRRPSWPPADDWQTAVWSVGDVRINGGHRGAFIPPSEILAVAFPGVDVSTRPGGLFTRIEAWLEESLQAAHGLPTFQEREAASSRVFARLRALGPDVTGISAA